jgi:hypothetical protein
MPGMTGPGSEGPALTNAFKAALLSQGSVALFIFVLLAFAWATSREAMPVGARVRLAAIRASTPAEPAARRLLRLGFGVLWVFDGVLQAQPAMPTGLLSRVVAPAAQGSPGWVLHLVGRGAAAWSAHPVQAAAGVVWLQVGIGLWLIAAPRGRWSQVAALVSAGWGLVIWVFGEAFGSIFAPGLSWLTGAPGSALLYSAAGLLLALPPRLWQDRRLGLGLLRASGIFLCGMAVLQAWPGRGFWQGRLHGQPGTLTAAVQSMAAMQQPASVARLVSRFGSVVALHGFAVNLVAVIVLAASGILLLTGRRFVIRLAVIVLLAFCLADWALVQDFGFFGGIGTDPNSMLPFALLLLAGYLATTRVVLAGRQTETDQAPAATSSGPVAPSEPPAVPGNPIPVPAELAAVTPPWRLRSPALRSWQLIRGAAVSLGTASSSAVIALWAVGLVGLGAIPMAAAEVHSDAAPVAVGAPGHRLSAPETRQRSDFSVTKAERSER